MWVAANASHQQTIAAAAMRGPRPGILPCDASACPRPLRSPLTARGRARIPRRRARTDRAAQECCRRSAQDPRFASPRSRDRTVAVVSTAGFRRLPPARAAERGTAQDGEVSRRRRCRRRCSRSRRHRRSRPDSRRPGRRWRPPSSCRRRRESRRRRRPARPEIDQDVGGLELDHREAARPALEDPVGHVGDAVRRPHVPGPAVAARDRDRLLALDRLEPAVGQREGAQSRLALGREREGAVDLGLVVRDRRVWSRCG